MIGFIIGLAIGFVAGVLVTNFVIAVSNIVFDLNNRDD